MIVTALMLEVTVAPGSLSLLNKKAVGYYRVNYDTQTWLELGDLLLTDHQKIHPFNRAQIICDVTHLSHHGVLQPETAQHVLQYFQQEQDFAPLRAYAECVNTEEEEEEEGRGFRRFKRK